MAGSFNLFCKPAFTDPVSGANAWGHACLDQSSCAVVPFFNALGHRSGVDKLGLAYTGFLDVGLTSGGQAEGAKEA